jgi:hypothetical protein
MDTVTINTDFAQSIIPGDDLIWSIGENTGDSSPRRWAQTHSPDWTNITTGAWPGSGLRPQTMTVSDQMSLDGIINKLSAIQSNDDILLSPNTGVVYVESVKFGEIQWVSPTTLNNPNAYSTRTDDEFGNAVAISSTYAIVGAYAEDDAGGSLSGKAYIYNPATGALLHTLNNPNAYSTSAFDYFGYSVAISDTRAIVGAFFEDDAGGLDSGKAYIYNPATGALLFTLNNPNPVGTSSGDNFGYSVAISSTYAIVGAYGEDGQSGKAYIYNATTGALLHTLNNPNAYGTVTTDRFGWSVSISDTYAVVGAYLEDDAGGLSSGKAYIFDVSTGALLQTLDNPNAYSTSLGDEFGRSVAISGARIIVGAPYEDEAGGSNSGKSYIFSSSINQSAIKNLLNTPLTLGSTGIGYTQFNNTNGMVITFGNNAERRLSPDIGETRWNTEEGYLECYDGTVWIVSTGGGIEVTVEIMEDLGHVYTLMLG